MTDKCDHKWWALKRAIEGSNVVEDEVMIAGQKIQTWTLPAEVYGKRCEHCGAERIFDKPVPDSEIEWAQTGRKVAV